MGGFVRALAITLLALEYPERVRKHLYRFRQTLVLFYLFSGGQRATGRSRSGR